MGHAPFGDSPTDVAIAPTGGTRPDYLVQLYQRLETLNERIGGPYYLSDCDGLMDFPAVASIIGLDEQFLAGEIDAGTLDETEDSS